MSHTHTISAYTHTYIYICTSHHIHQRNATIQHTANKHIIHHTSYIIHHIISHIIHHTSYIIHHTSYIIHHTSYINTHQLMFHKITQHFSYATRNHIRSEPQEYRTLYFLSVRHYFQLVQFLFWNGIIGETPRELTMHVYLILIKDNI